MRGRRKNATRGAPRSRAEKHSDDAREEEEGD